MVLILIFVAAVVMALFYTWIVFLGKVDKAEQDLSTLFYRSQGREWPERELRVAIGRSRLVTVIALELLIEKGKVMSRRFIRSGRTRVYWSNPLSG